MARKKEQAPPTPQVRFRSVIDSARKTMRKDAGLDGDFDRIPQLAWLLFLEAYDDPEMKRKIAESAYRPAIEARAQHVLAPRPEVRHWGHRDPFLNRWTRCTLQYN